MKVFLLSLLFTYGIVCQGLTPEDRLRELESVIQAQAVEYEELKNRVDALEGKLVTLKEERHGHVTDQEDLSPLAETSIVDVQEREMSTDHISKRQAVQNVAFHAYMNHAHCYGTGNRFVFDVVTPDHGRGFKYDKSTYDVPIAGVYVLTWTVAVPQHYPKMVTELVVNANAVAGVIISDPDSNLTADGVHPATGVAVVQLHASDHVYIKVTKTNGLQRSCILGDDNVARTTFSGWRLKD